MMDREHGLDGSLNVGCDHAMSRRFLITGTGDGVGKTTVGCALGFALRARGMRVGVMKPGDSLESKDARALAIAVGSDMPMESICANRHSSTPAAAEAPDLAHVAQCFDKIAAHNDVVLVESASMMDFVDLAATLGLEVILVVGNRPGCVDAAVLTLQRCENRELKVAGYILCDCDSATSSATATDEIEASLMRIGKAPYLGRMRHREPLARAIVEKLV
jgi:dethiobiotin synthetase